MSSINTNGINVNYPVPGVNNNSQGFRDNFASIKTNLDTAGTEITDLQNTVVVKSALAGTTVNNDMANTLISNALTRGFRASTYNLGNSISGSLVINASLGDVQYGTIAGNTTIQFAGWAPAGTQSNLQLLLNISNSNAVISFPSQVSMTGSYGVETLENFANISNVPTVTVPYGVTQLEYRLSTVDCGNLITIEPFNRPRQTSQIVQRTPSPIGQPGDNTGAVCVDPSSSLAFATCNSANATFNTITCDSTSGFYLDMPVVFTGFTGNSSFISGNVVAGATYYIGSIPSSTTFTITDTPGTSSGPGNIVAVDDNTGIAYVSPASYLYVASGPYDGNTLTRDVTNTTQVINTVTANATSNVTNYITVPSTAGFIEGYPVTFSGTPSTCQITAVYTDSNVTVSATTNMVVGGSFRVSGNAFVELPTGNYFINAINSSNIKLSNTFGGPDVTITSNVVSVNAFSTGTYAGVFGNVQANTTYYVKEINSLTDFSVSTVQGGEVTNLTLENGLMNVNATVDYRVTLSSTTSVSNNDPIMFTGNVFGGLAANTIYYTSNVSSPNISVSQTRYNGVSGQKLALSTASGNCIATIYQGTSIWKRTQLNNW